MIGQSAEEPRGVAHTSRRTQGGDPLTAPQRHARCERASGRHRRRAHRRPGCAGDQRPVRRRAGLCRARARGRCRGGGGAARLRAQAAHRAGGVPGHGRRGTRPARRGAPGHRFAGHRRTAGRRARRPAGPPRRRAHDRRALDAQHAAAPRRGAKWPGGGGEAGHVRDHRGVARRGALRHQRGQRPGGALRARHPHLRDGDAQHARPLLDPGPARAHRAAGDRRPQPRRRTCVAGARAGHGRGRRRGRRPAHELPTPRPAHALCNSAQAISSETLAEIVRATEMLVASAPSPPGEAPSAGCRGGIERHRRRSQLDCWDVARPWWPASSPSRRTPACPSATTAARRRWQQARCAARPAGSATTAPRRSSGCGHRRVRGVRAGRHLPRGAASGGAA